MMYYSNIRSLVQAGLVQVTLIFVLIIALVSAVPIPAAESELSKVSTSSSSLNG